MIEVDDEKAEDLDKEAHDRELPKPAGLRVLQGAEHRMNSTLAQQTQSNSGTAMSGNLMAEAAATPRPLSNPSGRAMQLLTQNPRLTSWRKVKINNTWRLILC